MELPLTSLVPTVVEITSFIEQNWPDIWWFPNWYLGVPLRFVTGPVVPALVILLRKLTGVSVEAAYIGLMSLMGLIGSVGIIKLVRELGGSRRQAGWSGVLFLLLPFHLLLLSYGSGLHHLAIALLPWVWWSWMRAVREVGGVRPPARTSGSANLEVWRRASRLGEVFRELRTVVLTTLVLLVDVGGFLPLLVGATVVTFLGEKRDWGERGVKSLLILLTAFSLATVWYTPRFWWVLLGNPSFGGKPLSNVIPFVLQLVQALIPLVLGIWVVQKRRRLSDKVIRFGVLFGASFLFLTVIRFLSDVDFWMDWTSYFLELQLAVSLVGGLLISRYFKRCLVIFSFISILTIFDGAVLFRWYKTNETNKTYKENIKKMITDHVVPGERVFLSGSLVFWSGDEIFAGPATRVSQTSCIVPANSGGTTVCNESLGTLARVTRKEGLWQVRGGRDEAATHPTWAMGAYQIREGEEAELLQNWLKVFGVSYILVHGESSHEYYRDFKNLERFTDLEKIVEADDDILYKSGGSIGRIADRRILQLLPPKEGSDRVNAVAYTDTLFQPVEVSWDGPSQIKVKVGELASDDVVSLAVTADPGWYLASGNGKLKVDVMGNILIDTKSNDLAQLKYRESLLNIFWAALGSGVSFILLVESTKLASFCARLSGIQLQNLADEEENY